MVTVTSETMNEGPRIRRLVAKARRDWMLIRFGLAAAAVVGAGVVAAATLAGNGDSRPIPPTKTQTPRQSPTTEASPTRTESPEPVGEECSSTELNDAGAYPREPQSELPPTVLDIRKQIIDAALRCDYNALNALALDGRDFFSYSFGAPGKAPGNYWRMIEEEEEPGLRQPVLSLLVQTFDLSYCTDQFEDPDGEGTVTQYAWPSASCARPTDEQWAELESLYSDEEIRGWKDFGSFIGWRIGILDDGDWTSYIAGD
jgi:hypothetical protein